MQDRDFWIDERGSLYYRQQELGKAGSPLAYDSLPVYRVLTPRASPDRLATVDIGRFAEAGSPPDSATQPLVEDTDQPRQDSEEADRKGKQAFNADLFGR